MRSYFADTATLARKDLRLELRARDTLPAMLLFVVAILVVFHFALPTGSSRLAELRPHATFLVTTHDPERIAALASDRLAFA